MKILKGLPVVGAASAVPLLFAANAATAAPTTVKAVTHLSDRPDTAGSGQVGAHDNLWRQSTVTPNADGGYTVVITESFSAFVEPNNSTGPNTLHPISADGSVKGTITYEVTASQGPDFSALPSHMSSNVTISAMIADLFDGTGNITGGGDYTYNYHAGADTCTQTTTSITGDITGK